MLTPRDIETREFSRSRAGYKTDEVEAFLDEVLADYTKVSEERDNYAKRVLSLSEKLESIREDQQSELKQMLEANFKTRDEIISEAKLQASIIIGTAKSEKENAVARIENELAFAREELEKIKLSKNSIIKEVENFKAVLRGAYETHIKQINSLPLLTKEELPIKEPVAEKIDFIKEQIKPAPVVEPEPETVSEPEEDLSATIIMKPAKREASFEEKEIHNAEEDEDLILSSSTKSEKPGAPFIRADEEKIKGLFEHDDKAKDKKPGKKQSRFFKQDNDDFFDDDFDDE